MVSKFFPAFLSQIIIHITLKSTSSNLTSDLEPRFVVESKSIIITSLSDSANQNYKYTAYLQFLRKRQGCLKGRFNILEVLRNCSSGLFVNYQE